jgi:hypothetical protein
MLADQLGELGVASANLLQDWLEHLWLLLDNLSQLLELRVISEKVEIS